MFNDMVKNVLENITITDILERINKHYGDRPALQSKNKDGSFRTISYVQLGRRAVDISSTLLKLGLAKGHSVAILSESRPEWAITFFGIISCGGVVIPLDIKLSEREIQYILTDSQAQFIFVSDKYFSLVSGLRHVLPNLKHIVLLDENPQPNGILLKDLKIKPGDPKYNPIFPDDTALIVYTSGTTGVAKGVEISYRNLLFEVLTLSDIIHFRPGDQFLSILPLNHMLEITGGLMVPLYAGACITYGDSLRVNHVLALMQEIHPKVMICVPLILKMLNEGIHKRVEKLPGFQKKLYGALLAFSRFLLKFNIRVGRLLFAALHKEFGGRLLSFVCGGAPLSPDIERDFDAWGFRILQGYGLTETSPVISVNTLTHHRIGSVGRPLPGVEVKIDHPSEAGKDGEILTRGPHVMKGYFRQAEKTAEMIKDGWLSTGDLGYLDKDGFLFISGRKRNLIVLGVGKKVFPEEVEEVMGHSPFIRDICVLARAATRGLREGSEEVYAVVFPNLDAFPEGERSDPAKIKSKVAAEFLRLGQHLAEYKRVSDFEIWMEELPKTVTRKIKRKVVEDQIRGLKHSV